MTPNRWVILTALFLARSTLGYQYQSVASVSPLLVEDLGINFAQVGALIGFYSLLGIVSALPAGLLGRRFGDRRIILLGAAMMVAGGFVMGLGDSYGIASLGRFVAGAGGVFITVLMTKVVGDWFSGREIVTALAILMNSWPVGIALGLVSQGAIAEAWGWQAVFLSTGVVCLAGMGLVALAARNRPGQSEPPAPDASAAGWRWTISRREAVLASLAGSIWILYNSGFIMIVSFAPAMLVERDFDIAEAGALISIGTWVYMFAIPIGGWLSERLRRPNVTMIGCFALATLFVAAVPFVEPVVLLFALAGIFVGIPTGNVMALTVETVRAENRNMGVGLYFSFHYLGLTTIPVIAGWSLDFSGSTAAPMFVGATCSALAIGVLGLLRFLQSRQLTGAAPGTAD
jgi:predicted MFS family arabinose efflux permease